MLFRSVSRAAGQSQRCLVLATSSAANAVTAAAPALANALSAAHVSAALPMTASRSFASTSSAFALSSLSLSASAALRTAASTPLSHIASYYNNTNSNGAAVGVFSAPARSVQTITPDSVSHTTSAMNKDALVSAIMSRDTTELRRLLSLPSVSVNMTLDANNATLLHTAAMSRSPEIVSVLLAAKADVNALDAAGATPLGIAITAQNEPVALQLLDAGADLTQWPAHIPTPVAFAVLHGLTGLLTRLIALGASPNVSTTAVDSHGRVKVPPPLLIATMRGSHAIARLLLEAGANPLLRTTGIQGSVPVLSSSSSSSGAKSEGASTAEAGEGAVTDAPPLLIAAANCDTAMTQLLLAHKADPLAMGRLSGALHSPLALACYNRSPIALVTALLDAGAGPDTARGATPHPLSSAVAANNAELTQLLLSRGADANILRDSNGMTLTPLFDALEARYDDVALALIKAGANPNSAVTYDENGNQCSPLMYAAYFNSTKLVAALLAAKANVNFTASQRNPITALHMAAVNGYTSVTRALLAAGADPNCAINGVRPLQMALTQGFIGPALALIEKGASLTTRDFADHDKVMDVYSRFFFTLEDVCPDATVTMKYSSMRRGSVAALGPFPAPFAEYVSDQSAASANTATDASTSSGGVTVFGGPSDYVMASVPTTDDVLLARKQQQMQKAAAAASAAHNINSVGASTAVEDDDEDVEIAVVNNNNSNSNDGVNAAAVTAPTASVDSALELPHSLRQQLPLRQKAMGELFKFNALEENAVLLPTTNGVVGWHPVVAAAWLGDAELLSAMLSRSSTASNNNNSKSANGADLSQATLTVALAWAVMQNNVSCARLLLAAGANSHGHLDTAAQSVQSNSGPANSTLLTWTRAYEKAETERWRAAARDTAAKARARERDIAVRRAAVKELAAADATAAATDGKGATATVAATGAGASAARPTGAAQAKRRPLEKLLAEVTVGSEVEAKIKQTEDAAEAAVTQAWQKSWAAKSVETAAQKAAASIAVLTPVDLAKLRNNTEMEALLTQWSASN